jgi:peptide/nickel transport system ATP-binding protein
VTSERVASPLLSIDQLSVTFDNHRRGRAPLRAVDDVSFDIAEGKTVALVGESGSGKSTIGNAILGLVRASGGSVDLRGKRVVDAHSIDRNEISNRIQVVFQDPYGSLNPSRTIGQTLVEPLLVRRRHFEGDRQGAVVDTLASVGLGVDVVDRYPSQFSGGQRQRIAIARALITQPDLIICDEPVSSLDLSVQAQVLNLLADQQKRTNVSYLFISHDLAVVRRISDSIVILYRGRVVEFGTSSQVVSRPFHPYTVALLNAAPVPDPIAQRHRRELRQALKLSEVSSSETPMGCQFAPRCPLAVERCVLERPELRMTPTGSFSACHRLEDVSALPV